MTAKNDFNSVNEIIEYLLLNGFVKRDTFFYKKGNVSVTVGTESIHLRIFKSVKSYSYFHSNKYPFKKDFYLLDYFSRLDYLDRKYIKKMLKIDRDMFQKQDHLINEITKIDVLFKTFSNSPFDKKSKIDACNKRINHLELFLSNNVFLQEA